jgi:hypothetical protein
MGLMLTARHMMLARAQREYEKMNFDGHYAIGVEWFQGRVRQLAHEAEKQSAEESRRAQTRESNGAEGDEASAPEEPG